MRCVMEFYIVVDQMVKKRFVMEITESIVKHCVVEFYIVAVLMVMTSLRRCCVMRLYIRGFRSFPKNDKSDISVRVVHMDRSFNIKLG